MLIIKPFWLFNCGHTLSAMVGGSKSLTGSQDSLLGHISGILLCLLSSLSAAYNSTPLYDFLRSSSQCAINGNVFAPSASWSAPRQYLQPNIVAHQQEQPLHCSQKHFLFTDDCITTQHAIPPRGRKQLCHPLLM